VGVKDFTVELDGNTVPILDVPLKAPDMGEDSDDPDASEYVARVRWVDARPSEQAVRDKDMFANQNVVAKLRDPYALQRLTETFKIETADTG
jgi:hypothetical protein